MGHSVGSPFPHAHRARAARAIDTAGAAGAIGEAPKEPARFLFFRIGYCTLFEILPGTVQGA